METRVDLSDLSTFDVKDLKSMVFDLSMDIGKKTEAVQIIKQEILKRDASSKPATTAQ